MITVLGTYELGNGFVMKILDDGYGPEILFNKNDKEYLLTLQRYQQLLESVEDIQKAVNDHKQGKDVHYMNHLGGNNYVQVNSGFKVVDVRKFWLPQGQIEVRPTKKGIALKFDEFDTLVKLRTEIEQKIPELASVRPCWTGDDHMNQLGALSCSECNPSDFHNW